MKELRFPSPPPSPPSTQSPFFSSFFLAAKEGKSGGGRVWRTEKKREGGLLPPPPSASPEYGIGRVWDLALSSGGETTVLEDLKRPFGPIKATYAAHNWRMFRLVYSP